MNWKEFLKPNGRKIAVFLILFLISLFCILYFSGFGPPRDFRQDCCNIQNTFNAQVCNGIISGTVPGFRSGLYFNKTPEEICREYNLSVLESLMLFIIIIFVIPYLLSCIIIWIYYKVKKKK